MTGWGQDGPLAAAGRARHQLHLADRRAARDRPAPASGRCRRSTWSATSAAARCCWSSACSPRCGRRSARARARSSTRRWSTARACSSQMVWGLLRAAGSGATSAGVNLLDGARAVLRHLHLRRRPARRGRRARAAVLRRAAGRARARRRRAARAVRPRRAGRVLRARFAEAFATRTRDEWAEVFAGTDACVTPVLAFGEVAAHPHLAARGDDRRAGRRGAGRPGAAVLPHRHRGPRADAGAGGRRVGAGRLGLTRRTALSVNRSDESAVRALRAGAQPAAAVSSTSRLRVRLGSTGMPGPVVVAKVTFLR